MHSALKHYAIGIDGNYAMCILPPMPTSDEIKAARFQLGESQAAFGLRFGIDQSTVHRWETNGLPERGTARVAVENLLEQLRGRRQSSAHAPRRSPRRKTRAAA